MVCVGFNSRRFTVDSLWFGLVSVSVCSYWFCLFVFLSAFVFFGCCLQLLVLFVCSFFVLYFSLLFAVSGAVAVTAAAAVAVS